MGINNYFLNKDLNFSIISSLIKYNEGIKNKVNNDANKIPYEIARVIGTSIPLYPPIP